MLEPNSGENRIACGPLLRYTYIDYEASPSVWNGSILVVMRSSESPKLTVPSAHHVTCLKLCSECEHDFWRFDVAVRLSDNDQKIEYTVENNSYDFHVPGIDDSMRMMFYSCNEYSIGVERYVGVLWTDVLRKHEKSPFHVMIGGGDQVYSDKVRTKYEAKSAEGPQKESQEDGPLYAWASSPLEEKTKTRFDGKLQENVDKWYFNNYLHSYGAEVFKDAMARIPCVQILDDHDIIDGYGSYSQEWMTTPVFLGLGQIAWKYYMLFQHHTVPSDDEPEREPWWMLGEKEGPYIKARSRSICTTFGKRVIFFGLDCRAERTNKQVCSRDTYNKMFKRLEEKIVTGQTKHLILLLSLPLAYPRLVWLEKLLSSSVVENMLKGLSRIGILKSQVNKFDGKPELLDDLNDHWCSTEHKEERNKFVKKLQEFSASKNVRVTILSGDVHLACVGRFFHKKSSAPSQNKDYRYMVNIVSSAITNKPPPPLVAHLTHLGNKLHNFKFDENTHENLMSIFDKNPNPKAPWYKLNWRINHTTLSARNYCVITENAGLAEPHAEEQADIEATNGHGGREGNKGASAENMEIAYKQKGKRRDPSDVTRQNSTKPKYSLDVAIHAEVNPRDSKANTIAYEFIIPILDQDQAVHEKTRTA